MKHQSGWIKINSTKCQNFFLNNEWGMFWDLYVCQWNILNLFICLQNYMNSGWTMIWVQKSSKNWYFLLKHESPFLTDFDEITTKIYLQSYTLMHFFTKFFTIQLANLSWQKFWFPTRTRGRNWSFIWQAVKHSENHPVFWQTSFTKMQDVESSYLKFLLL